MIKVSKFMNESASSNLLRYDISGMDSMSVLGLAKKFSNVRDDDNGNYSSYKLIGTAEELAGVLKYCKSKGANPRKSKVTAKDIKWYENNVSTNESYQMAEFEFKCSKCGLVFKDTYDYPLPTDCNAAVRCPKCKSISHITDKKKYKLVNESSNLNESNAKKKIFKKGDRVAVTTSPYGRITGTVLGISKNQYGTWYTNYDVKWDRDPNKVGCVEDYNMTLINESVSVVLDEDKLEKSMDKHHYDADSYLEFLYDIYGLEDGEDFQVGNTGLDLMFYSDSPKVKKLRKELGESMIRIDKSMNEAKSKSFKEEVADIINAIDSLKVPTDEEVVKSSIAELKKIRAAVDNWIKDISN